ncbi:MAG: pseudouridine synthase, partial [Rhodococcus sp. (in: high G+C Gram-positive bacteria)]
MVRAPLPIRDGLGPTRVRLPDASQFGTILGYLVDRFPQDSTRLREKMDLGEIVDASGYPLVAESP